tara:strand:+ start:1362 stop:1700 length:339 start_codon:yes stop_codon:yes gene_type:complete
MVKEYEREESGEVWDNYGFKVQSPENYDPKNVAADVRINTRTGHEYSVDFVTLDFLDWVFDKNRKTGECAKGTYFAMPKMIVVQEVSHEVIKRTLDKMIENTEIDLYLERLE